MTQRSWLEAEKYCVERLGGRWVGGDNVADGYLKSTVQVADSKGVWIFVGGASIEVKASDGPYYKNGNWSIWTSRRQVNAIAAANGVFVIVHRRTGIVYAIPGTKVEDYSWD